VQEQLVNKRAIAVVGSTIKFSTNLTRRFGTSSF
jgi:hypothetical protein